MTFEPLPTGTILLSRYKIASLIRRGGMGAAYRCEDLETGKFVAVKELLDSFENQDEREAGIGNFLAEMGILKSLQHPQIPRILDHFVEKRGFFLVLEYVKGKDWTAKLEETNRAGFPEETVARVGIQVCHVLEYLHNRKPEPIIHRDIKSSNIMEREKDGRIMVLDFGIARAARPKEGMMIGTLGYAPPEQHANRIDPRSDIYALGATLHELLTGKRPDARSFAFIPPNELRVEISSLFSQIVMTALNYRSEERFQNAKLFEDALQSLLPSPLPPLAIEPFREAATQFAKNFLFPLLSDIRQNYPNECQADSFTDFPDHFVFTLGIQVPYSLIVEADEEKEAIVFYLKEGLLSRKLLGEVFPVERKTWENARKMVDQFLASYQTSTG